jgi:uncharacterized protein
MPRTTRRPRALVPVVLLLLLAGYALAGEIAVTASGVAHGPPDMATLDVGYTTTDADVAAALAEADAAITAVRAALEAGGVDPLDVRTTTFSVWREERFEDRQGPTVVVYRVTHHLQVTVREVEAVGVLLVAATEAGANYVGGIEFSVQDARELQAAARREAFEAALVKARQLADLAGLTLGDVVNVVEAAPGAPVMPFAERSALTLGDAGAPVTGGRLAVEVRLEVVFAAAP